MKRVPLHLQILAAILLAIATGILVGPYPAVVGVLEFIGTLFLNGLRMVVVPLIVAAIVSGIGSISGGNDFGRLGLKTLVYYVSTTLIAVLIGLALVNLIQPGASESMSTLKVASARAGSAQLANLEGRGWRDLVDILQRFVPQNVVQSAASGDMLGLIFFSIVFGFFAARLSEEPRKSLLGFFRALHDVMLLITGWIMRFAPIGVFALIAKVVASTGLEMFRQVAWFFLTVLLALVIHMGVVLPLLVRLLGRVNPWRHFRAMSPALLTAFSTASSSATLPLTLKCVEERAGVSNRTTSLVVPLGATVNMDGTALYECIAVLFIAQAYGVDLTLGTQVTVVLLALLTSIGVAGIPAASLVAIVIIMNAVGVPAEGLGLILAVDRILDMCRTAVNVFSDSCGAVIIARSEGEQDILKPSGSV